MRLRAVIHPALIAGLFLAGSAPAQVETPPPVQPEADILAIGTDATDRMTVDVSIGDAGPYAFLVDTGSERTIISTELATTLGLLPGKPVMLHSMSGSGSVRTVVIPSLQVRTTATRNIQAPLLERGNLGALGMLGIDTLRNQRVLLDFKAGTMTISPGRQREEQWDPDTIVVKAKSRFGQLILSDANVDGRRVQVIIDTGAQVSIGNAALRRLLMRKRKALPKPLELISVTGGKIYSDYTVIDRMRIGGMEMTNIPIAFADAHPFRKFGIGNRPALMLGMDTLRMFDRVSLDFANRTVRFLIPDEVTRAADTRLAERAAINLAPAS